MANVNKYKYLLKLEFNPQCTNSMYCYTYRRIQKSTKALYREHCLRQKLGQCQFNAVAVQSSHTNVNA